MQAQVVPIHRHLTESIFTKEERKAHDKMKNAVGSHEEVEFFQLKVGALPFGRKV
jgi:hypothetical protein